MSTSPNNLVNTLASYVPAPIARRLAANPQPLTEPLVDQFPAAVMFADISGFTVLAEHLTQMEDSLHGPESAEALTTILNDYFGQLIDLIMAHGGEVVKFAGDALFAIWPTTDEDLEVVTLRAAQCGLEIQTKLHNYQATDDIRLSLSVNVAAGDVLNMYLGGKLERWELLVTGEPLIQMSIAEQQAQPGDVILAPSAWKLVGEFCTGEQIPGGNMRLKTTQSLPERPRVSPVLSPESEASLRAYVPAAILKPLDAGQTAWLSEIRRVTIIFINLPNLLQTTPGALEQVQRVMYQLQTALYKFEGSINKLNVDDKGTTLVAALGLPPLAHPDDAIRGVRAATEMQSQLRRLGMRSAIGIASGQAFCGTVGNQARREYTMMGNVVNLATRLMQAATNSSLSAAGILCDRATYQAARTALIFRKLPAITVKGKATKVDVYQPTGIIKKTGERFTRDRNLIGRTLERDLLNERLQLLKDGQSSLIIIEGEMGIGKSKLVDTLRQQAKTLDVTTFYGIASAIDQSTPYYAWRGVFNQLLALDVMIDPEKRRQHVLDLMELEPQLLHLAPLLNPVLGIDLPENEFIAHMDGQARADHVSVLLLQLLQTAASRSPNVVILEDAHWLDSASWTLASFVSEWVQPLLLVIALRPLGNARATKYPQLLDAPGTKHLRLDNLSLEESEELICQRLGIDSLPPVIAFLIHKHAEGHPFFSEELAYTLRDSGLITIVDGVCEISTAEETIPHTSFPNTIQGIITSRIDRLTPAQQMTIKTASVIGRVFPFYLLHDIYPIADDRPQLEEMLNTLEQLNIVALETVEPEPTYTFKQLITQEVVYNLMPFAQRQQLHRAVAEWYERIHADDLSPFYPLMSHHWNEARVIDKALDYLEKSAAQALQGGSYQEAARFFNQLLELADNYMITATPDMPARFRVARWERKLGESYYHLGQLGKSSEYLTRALISLGYSGRPRRDKLTANLLRQLIRQAIYRLRQPANLSAEARANVLEAAQICEQLSQIYYLTNKKQPAAYMVVYGLNLAETAGPSSELTRLYANMSLATGLMRLHRIARLYGREAHKMAATLNEPHTLGRILFTIAIYNAGMGQWAKVDRGLNQAIEIFENLNARRSLEESLFIQAQTAHIRGQFLQSSQLWERAHASAQRRNDSQVQGWGLRGQAEGLLRLGEVGNIDKALQLLNQSTILLNEDKNTSAANLISNSGLLALAHLQQGRFEPAQLAADEALQLLTTISIPTTLSVLEGYIGVAEVYLTLWEINGYSPTLAGDAEKACKALHQYARVFPVGQPRAWLWRGHYNWLTGNANKARRAWQKSLGFAEQLNMPYDQGLVHYEIGRHLPNSDPERKEHLVRALELFTKLGAVRDLARTQAVLDFAESG